MTETFDLSGLTFEVRRSERRSTLGLTVDREGCLIVHAPAATPSPELRTWTKTKLVWVHRKLATKESLSPRQSAPEFVTGESFSFLGRSHRLSIVKVQAAPLIQHGRTFTLRAADRENAERLFRQWYIDAGTSWLVERSNLVARKVGAWPLKVSVGDLGFRWGSCGKGRVIRFNWRVVQLPVRLADYVIAHELSHLLEPHHGTEFWKTLERAVPDWRERQATLATSAHEFLAFPINVKAKREAAVATR